MNLNWHDTYRKQSVGPLDVRVAYHEDLKKISAEVQVMACSSILDMTMSVNVTADEMRKLASALLAQADYRDEIEAALAARQIAAAPVQVPA